MRFLTCVLLVACQHTPIAETLVEGSRLRALTLTAAGGVSIDYAFYDTALAVPCGFIDVGGGEIVCAPSAVATSKLFADAACTQPVTLGSARDGYGIPYAFAVTTEDAPACGVATATYNHVTPSSGAQVYDGTKGCAPLALLPNLPPVIYAIGAVVKTSELVSGAKIVTKIDGRFSAKGFAGADGSKQPTSSWQEPPLLDTSLGQQCSLAFSIDDTLRCMPAPTVDQVDTNAFFSDAGCSNFATVACEATAYDFTWDGQCGPFDSAHAIPSSTSPLTSVYTSTGAKRVCQAATVGAGVFPYVLEQQISPSTFASFKPSVDGSGRLRVHRAADGAGADIVQGLYDSQTGHECFIAPTGDGKPMACIPNTHFSLYFSDSACTVPIAVWQPGTCNDPGGTADAADTSPSDPTFVTQYTWDSVATFTVGTITDPPSAAYGQYLTIPANGVRTVVCAPANLVANSEFHAVTPKALSDFPSASIVIPSHK